MVSVSKIKLVQVPGGRHQDSLQSHQLPQAEVTDYLEPHPIRRFAGIESTTPMTTLVDTAGRFTVSMNKKTFRRERMQFVRGGQRGSIRCVEN